MGLVENQRTWGTGCQSAKRLFFVEVFASRRYPCLAFPHSSQSSSGLTVSCPASSTTYKRARIHTSKTLIRVPKDLDSFFRAYRASSANGGCWQLRRLGHGRNELRLCVSGPVTVARCIFPRNAHNVRGTSSIDQTRAQPTTSTSEYLWPQGLRWRTASTLLSKIQNKNIIDLVVISTWRRVSFTDFGTEINGGDGLERRLCVVGK